MRAPEVFIRLATVLGLAAGASGTAGCADAQKNAQTNTPPARTTENPNAYDTPTVTDSAGNKYDVQFPPTPEATATQVKPTPTEPPTTTATPEKPELSPVEQVIKTGRLELKGENDWEKYFVAVTPKEAQTLLDEANAGVTKSDNLKFILPFDPSKTPNLVLQVYKQNPEVSEAQPIGVSNLPVPTEFYAPVSGDSTYQVQAIGKDRGIYCLVKKGNENHGLFVKKDVKAFIKKFTEAKLDAKIPVKIGDKLLIDTEFERGLDYFHGQFQTYIGVSKDGDTAVKMTLDNLLRKMDKFVYISQQAGVGK